MRHARLLLSFFGGALLFAQSVASRAGDIVDTDYVAAAAERGAIIWDMRSAKDYAAGHIPGAVSIGNAGEVLRDPNKEDFLATEKVEDILNEAGIDLDREVIVYGDTGDPYAHWGLVTIRYFGGRQGKVYHGGLDDWKASGRPLSTQPTKLPVASQKLVVQPGVLIHTKDVLAKLRDPNVQFLDVRTAKEYSGDDIRALRGGHIPGALNIAYEKNWTDPELAKKLKDKQVKTRAGAALKPEEQLKGLYADLDPAKETIVYCQSGVRASETANVMRALGFDKVRVYEESWLGYGNTLDAPAHNVSFVNVGALQGRIAKLEASVADLGAQLEAARKPKQD
jgi:thiosulfate/3-mercaptopyruvate sulfurtransferase